MNTIKDIPGYESLYAITESGKVFSYPKLIGKKIQPGKWIKPNNSTGIQYGLYKDGKRKVFSVKVLLLLTYDNINTINNLNPNLKRRGKRPSNIKIINLDTGEVFTNLQLAGNSINTVGTNISQSITRNSKCGNYRWAYYDKEFQENYDSLIIKYKEEIEFLTARFKNIAKSKLILLLESLDINNGRN